jgi:hypothetical protein
MTTKSGRKGRGESQTGYVARQRLTTKQTRFDAFRYERVPCISEMALFTSWSKSPSGERPYVRPRSRDRKVSIASCDCVEMSCARASTCVTNACFEVMRRCCCHIKSNLVLGRIPPVS